MRRCIESEKEEGDSDVPALATFDDACNPVRSDIPARETRCAIVLHAICIEAIRDSKSA